MNPHRMAALRSMTEIGPYLIESGTLKEALAEALDEVNRLQEVIDNGASTMNEITDVANKALARLRILEDETRCCGCPWLMHGSAT